MAEKSVVVVTGGGGGIGLAAAKMFKDYTVMISDVASAALEKGKAELNDAGIEAVTQICDVSDVSQVAAMAKAAAALGKVKGVVHCAGVSGDIGRLDLVIKIDLLGTYYMVEEFLKVMDGGSMVLISSMMADTIPPQPEQDALLINPLQEGIVEKLGNFCNHDPHQAYDLTKRGVRLLVKKYASLCGKQGIRINSVSPGVIMTDMALKAAAEHPEQMKFMEAVAPLGRNGQPEEVADLIYYLCSKGSSFITGIDVKVDGGAMDAVLAYKRNPAQSR